MAQQSKLYAKRKRRMLGEVRTKADLKTENAWVTVHSSSKELLMTYESEGFVVSINGSGTLEQRHTQVQEAAALAKHVAEQDGIILNGGRKTGIMGAVAKAAPENTIGIRHSFLDAKDVMAGIPQIMVRKPSPRIEALATCTPIIVIFQGGLGSTQELIRAIVHHSNVQHEGDQLPHVLFINSYWYPLLDTMVNMGAIPREYLSGVNFFHKYEEVIENLPK